MFWKTVPVVNNKVPDWVKVPLTVISLFASNVPLRMVRLPSPSRGLVNWKVLLPAVENCTLK